MALAACGQNRQEVDPKRQDLLLQQFSKIAFSSEMGGDRRPGHLVRWVYPIRVWVPRDGIGERYLGPIHERIQQIRQITRHDIALASPVAGTGNLHIRFVSQDQVTLAAKSDAPCHTQVVAKQGQIVWGTILISQVATDKILHCLTEELTQAMGLLDDSDLVTGSIFNDTSGHRDLILADTIMLRVLYDRRLWPGMTKAQALPIARNLIGDFLR